MSYDSFTYLLLFLPAVFVVYTIVPKKIKWSVLLLGSYVFYIISSGGLLVYMLLSTLSIYFAGLFLNKINDGYDLCRKALDKDTRKQLKSTVAWQKKGVVALCLMVNFGLLLFLKYFNFFGGSINSLLNMFNLSSAVPTLKLMLPLGISFYTLQAVSYVIDVYRGKYKASRNIGKVALFLSFFPQIVEGPIGRFDLLADQLYEGHSFNYDRDTKALQLLLWGLFEKVVIANRANKFVTMVFDNSDKYAGTIVIFAMLVYTLQIYADFAGCIDIVTGSAQLFGVKLSKNFERPFFSKSVNEFWRRWHITLGSWLRDYIFYSVSLSKVFLNLSKWTKKHFNDFIGSLVPVAFALFFVWFGNGFWHGASWKYISYGLYYYAITMLGMLFEPLFVKFFNKTKINRQGKVFGAFQMLRTFVLVNLGMLLFRAKSVTAWLKMIKSMFRGLDFKCFSSGLVAKLGLDAPDIIMLGVGLLAMLIVGILQERGHHLRDEIAQKNIVLRWILYFGLIFSVILFGAYGSGYGAVAFIYGQF